MVVMGILGIVCVAGLLIAAWAVDAELKFAKAIVGIGLAMALAAVVIGFVYLDRKADNAEKARLAIVDAKIEKIVEAAGRDDLDIVAVPIPCGRSGGWRGYEVSLSSEDRTLDVSFKTDYDDEYVGTTPVIVSVRKTDGDSEIVKISETQYRVYAK